MGDAVTKNKTFLLAPPYFNSQDGRMYCLIGIGDDVEDIGRLVVSSFDVSSKKMTVLEVENNYNKIDLSVAARSIQNEYLKLLYRGKVIIESTKYW